MTTSVPFIDSQTGALDTEQIRNESYRVVGLISLFVGLAFIPFILSLLIFANSGIGLLFTLLTQFILAVGTAIVLMYVIARAIQLADA
jgi:hypothetical protein